MNLKFIKEENCPKCGCNLITGETIEVDSFSKDKYAEHCNGGRWETRKFSCGMVLEYCPNFSCTEEKGICTKTDKYKKEMEQKEKFRKDLEKFIDEYDIAKKYRDRAKYHIYVG